ncbi:DUF6476 family protein [Paracoccus sp. p3-h83]|uniref:DUF6476 family protein n=1 Tax=Paracoccus sp. p3-h83 TaxID=3342805 RepID=UPI0035B85280
MSKSSSSESNELPLSALPPELRFLKRLVTALALVMIFGLLAIVALLVIRLGKPAPVLPDLPAAISLPAGEQPQALTFAPGYTVVVTQTGRVLIYAADGSLHRDVTP